MLRLAACLCLATLAAVGSAGAAGRGGEPVALVTAERENQLLAVDLPSGRIVRRGTLPADPQNVDVVGLDAVVAVSTRAGAVTVLEPRSLRVIRVLRGFGAPHIAAIHPTGEWAYVTDDARGELAVIALPSGRLVRKLYVGLGAHHLAVSPGGDRLWIALGERARTIVVADTSAPSRPRVVGRFDPGFGAHDLAFDPDGTRVWVTSDQRNDVAVFDASTRRLLFRVPVGPPPQHVAFNDRYAYLTSGYGSRILMASSVTGRVLRTASVPYGSFNLSTAGGIVATSSLLRGTVTELTELLRPMRTVRVARSARDVGITVW
jgi:YVTN family beta-propeller protein